jgi:zinc finger SWIM domain-containing protein 3
MDDEGADMEESDEYLRVISKTFRSEEGGYQFYNKYAKVKGFNVRKEEVKDISGTRMHFRGL